MGNLCVLCVSAVTFEGEHSESRLPRSAEPRRSAGVLAKGGVMNRREVAKSGISFGTALAIVISWTTHKSILWAIIHGLLSWLYVIYYALTR